MRTMTNPSPAKPAQSPNVPSVKTSLPPGEWEKRVGSRVYRRKAKRMISLLSHGESLSRRERADQSHYWLDSAVVEDRRQRSPSERLADSKPTDSVRY